VQGTGGMRPRILFVERTPEVARAVAAVLERHQFDVARTDDHAEAAARIHAEHFDVLLVEVKAAGDGFHFLRHVKDAAPHLTPRIVVISDDSHPAVLRELEAIGVCDLVVRPVHETEILEAIAECLDRSPAVVQ
jgi:two-component system response regulator TctD